MSAEISFVSFGKPTIPPKYYAQLVICGLGLVGNLLAIIIIVAKLIFLKSITHWYILQIFIAETLFLISLPLQALEDRDDGWNFPNWVCTATLAIAFIRYYASILFLIILCIDRYLVVHHRLSKRVQTVRKLKPAVGISLFVWTISILMAMPAIIFGKVNGIKPFCKCTLSFDTYENLVDECLGEGSTEEFCRDLFQHYKNGTDYCRSFPLSLFEYDQSGGSLDILTFEGVGEFGDEEADQFGEYNFFEGLGSGFLGSGFLDSGLGSGNAFAHIDFENPLIAYSCHYFDHSKGWKTFVWFNFVAILVLSVPFSVLYGLIYFQPKTSANLRNISPRSNTGSKWMTGICAALVMTFIACWLPLYSVHVAKLNGIWGRDSQFCSKLVTATAVLGFFNSALNPMIYGFLGIAYLIRRRKSETLSRKSSTSKWDHHPDQPINNVG